MASLDNLPLRSDLRGKKPYGAPMLPVRYALNVNENTHPVPDAVRASILASLADALESINRYPDREFAALRDSLAEYASESHRGDPITSDMVWAANGSNEV
ncbi:MAG: histidinol-phosphate transaminase, partial [Actinomycetota bacterium]|nr:histidinol-phosphate transaminase [Actinomycetota bacterium]